MGISTFAILSNADGRRAKSLRRRLAGHAVEHDALIFKYSLIVLSGIYKFRQIGDNLGTAGQPTESQLHAVRAAGYDAVINLALPTSDNAIAGEGSIVSALGMSYVHIPVDFKAPTAQDFRTFCGVMKAFDGRQVFVHCAANMRVSAFIFLYRVLVQQHSASEAERDLFAIWQPDEVWARFIQDQLESDKGRA